MLQKSRFQAWNGFVGFYGIHVLGLPDVPFKLFYNKTYIKSIPLYDEQCALES